MFYFHTIVSSTSIIVAAVHAPLYGPLGSTIRKLVQLKAYVFYVWRPPFRPVLYPPWTEFIVTTFLQLSRVIINNMSIWQTEKISSVTEVCTPISCEHCSCVNSSEYTAWGICYRWHCYLYCYCKYYCYYYYHVEIFTPPALVVEEGEPLDSVSGLGTWLRQFNKIWSKEEHFKDSL